MTMAWAVTYASTIWGSAAVIKYYAIPWLCVTHWFVMITYVRKILLSSRSYFPATKVVVVHVLIAPSLFRSTRIFTSTQLHHTDKRLPHYRKGAWNFQRGAACTVDRPFLGWQGRFFLHDIAHYHVIHHFFPKIPFWNAEEATGYLRKFIGEQYAYDARNPFAALWETYNDCQFVEDEGASRRQLPRFFFVLGLPSFICCWDGTNGFSTVYPGDVVFYRDRKGKAVCQPSVAFRSPPSIKSE